MFYLCCKSHVTHQDQPKLKKSRSVLGLPGYSAQGDPGDASAMRKINLLKPAESPEEVELLMTATFAARRKAIVDDGASVQEVQEIYPALFGSVQVCMVAF